VELDVLKLTPASNTEVAIPLKVNGEGKASKGIVFYNTLSYDNV
jgi:hypothetical protein